LIARGRIGLEQAGDDIKYNLAMEPARLALVLKHSSRMASADDPHFVERQANYNITATASDYGAILEAHRVRIGAMPTSLSIDRVSDVQAEHVEATEDRARVPAGGLSVPGGVVSQPSLAPEIIETDFNHTTGAETKNPTEIIKIDRKDKDAYRFDPNHRVSRRAAKGVAVRLDPHISDALIVDAETNELRKPKKIGRPRLAKRKLGRPKGKKSRPTAKKTGGPKRVNQWDNKKKTLTPGWLTDFMKDL